MIGLIIFFVIVLLILIPIFIFTTKSFHIDLFYYSGPLDVTAFPYLFENDRYTNRDNISIARSTVPMPDPYPILRYSKLVSFVKNSIYYVLVIGNRYTIKSHVDVSDTEEIIMLKDSHTGKLFDIVYQTTIDDTMVNTIAFNSTTIDILPDLVIHAQNDVQLGETAITGVHYNIRKGKVAETTTTTNNYKKNKFMKK